MGKKKKKTSPVFEMDLAHCEQFVVMWNTTFKTSLFKKRSRYTDQTGSCHLTECQHFKFCNTFFLGYYCGRHVLSTPKCVIVNSPGYFGSLTSSLNHGCCSKPSQQFIIPTCLGFVSLLLFCKRMIFSPFVLKRQTHDLAIPRESTH